MVSRTVQQQAFKRTAANDAAGRGPRTTALQSALMSRVRQSGTAPELAIRAVATKLGLRYRIVNRDLPGSPDIANRSKKWAVFVHGCFWHRHPHCSKATMPKRNAAFWSAKFDANSARDARVASDLRRLGYRVIVIWECQIGKSEARRALARLVRRPMSESVEHPR